jgi:hypothetical protein
MACDVAAHGVADDGTAQLGSQDLADRAVIEVPHHATETTAALGGCPASFSGSACLGTHASQFSDFR